MKPIYIIMTGVVLIIFSLGMLVERFYPKPTPPPTISGYVRCYMNGIEFTRGWSEEIVPAPTDWVYVDKQNGCKTFVRENCIAIINCRLAEKEEK